jgi:UDP-glucose 4-epimerase
MKVVIIGINGYLGKHLAHSLNKLGWDVFGYGRQHNSTVQQKEYKVLDINNAEDLNKINLDVDFVFYFAGITGTVNAFHDFKEFVQVNEIGILNLLSEMRKQSSSARIVYPSTRLVYKGLKDTQLKESDEKEFKSIYALTKWFGEQVIEQYFKYFEIPFTIYRICVPYGNCFNEEYSYGTIGFFLKNAQNGKDINLYGDGLIKRTFTHVSDIVSQIVESLINPAAKNSILNIGGETLTLKEAALAIASTYSVNVTYSAWPKLDKLLESGDTIFDDSLIRNLTNKKDQYCFDSWLNQLK